jgi:predicted signal transduction protein with EAL and GGDEF domain
VTAVTSPTELTQGPGLDDAIRALRPSAGARADFSSLADRMSYLLGLRIAMAAIITVWAFIRPEALLVPFWGLGAVTAGYLTVALVGEVVRRRFARISYATMTFLLLVDGLYLAGAMYLTGGTDSPIRFMVYLQLVGVSLLASYRTGLKMALWDSLLLFVLLYAQAARLMPAIDTAPGVAIEFEQMPVLNVTSFWLFAIATSIFSALNERELRQRRADLQSLVEVGSKLDAASDAIHQAEIVLSALTARFEFERAVLLGETDGRVVALAALGTTTPPTTASDPDWIVRRAWERREILPVKALDAGRDPLLSSLMPDARNVLVAPMIAESRTVGAIVVEHRAHRRTGVERRVAAMLGQFASVAALNLRNAVLLQHVQDLAERDSLTGAANRRMFQAALERVLQKQVAAPRADKVTAVLFLDLDDFKVINDTLGHAAGDELLIAVTERIAGLVREDEPLLSRARSMAGRLVYELRSPYLIGEKHVVVTASVGIASARDTSGDAVDLVRNADVAMYMAKANGKSGFAIFDPGMHEAMRERHELSVDLQRAVDDDQLTLLYQPIVDMATDKLAGVEALVRWSHPGHGTIMPDQFIEIAEETGAILPIGHWVLREACRQGAMWLAGDRVPADAFVSVNVSAREIQSLGFVDGIKAVLAESGLEPTHLVLEITETALLKANPTTVATLEAVRALGVRTVIDDFGTGYFSLSHLRQFPVDALKIAKEFVQETDEGSKSSALAGAIVAMSRSLGIQTVAEGIETPEQAERMRKLGCAYAQGYAYARPMLETDLLARFDASSTIIAAAAAEIPAAAAATPPSEKKARKSPVRATSSRPVTARVSSTTRAPRTAPRPAA